MKKLLLTVLMLIGIILVLKAQSPIKKYNLNVHDFTELKVVNGINVEYSACADSAGTVCFECSKDMAPHLIFSNRNNALSIQIDSENIPSGPLPRLRVYSSNLHILEKSGDSTVTVLSLAPVNTFNAKLIGNGTMLIHNVDADNVNASISTGSGHLLINGKSAKARLSNVGTGPLEANALDCKTVKCILVGTGPIDCHVTEQLNIYGAGSGTVYYSGKPKKIQNRTIGVKSKEVE
ncbi:MAG: DUF2807 domain-containing protein [Muribaculaceae bacterium]|nr:DUF2807 domain-containing protein [Muribaculaceae bacterium]